VIALYSLALLVSAALHFLLGPKVGKFLLTIPRIRSCAGGGLADADEVLVAWPDITWAEAARDYERRRVCGAARRSTPVRPAHR
jgi:hypothetical protein